MAILYGWGSTVSKLRSHYEATVYFLGSASRLDKNRCMIVRGWVHYILAGLFFLSKRENSLNLEKWFCFTLKALSVLVKSKFWYFGYLNPWRHQMPQQKTRKNFYWKTWEVNTVCSVKLACAVNINLFFYWLILL